MSLAKAQGLRNRKMSMEDAMGFLHDLMVMILGWFLILGAALHGLATWRRIGHATTEFVWSFGAALAALTIGVLNLLLIHRPRDAALALLAATGALAWAAIAQAFGRAIQNPSDPRVLWHLACGAGLAFLGVITLVGALL